MNYCFRIKKFEKRKGNNHMITWLLGQTGSHYLFRVGLESHSSYMEKHGRKITDSWNSGRILLELKKEFRPLEEWTDRGITTEFETEPIRETGLKVRTKTGYCNK